MARCQPDGGYTRDSTALNWNQSSFIRETPNESRFYTNITCGIQAALGPKIIQTVFRLSLSNKDNFRQHKYLLLEKQYLPI